MQNHNNNNNNATATHHQQQAKTKKRDSPLTSSTRIQQQQATMTKEKPSPNIFCHKYITSTIPNFQGCRKRCHPLTFKGGNSTNTYHPQLPRVVATGEFSCLSSALLPHLKIPAPIKPNFQGWGQQGEFFRAIFGVSPQHG